MKKLTLVGILALLASCDGGGSHAVDAKKDTGTGAAGTGAAGSTAGTGAAGSSAAGSSAGGGTAGAAAGTGGGMDAAAGTGTDAASGTDAPAGGDATDATNPGSDAKDAAAGPDASDAGKTDAGGGSDATKSDAGVEAGKDADEPETVANCGRVKCDCTFKGKKLAGKVKYATTIPYDFTVNVVTNFLPDLYVVEIPSPGIANRCGQWQPEQNLPQLTVMKVTNGLGDFDIQYVTSPTLPGLPTNRGGP